MISIDDMKATAKRMSLIINNSSDDAEVFVAMQIQQNLDNLAKQLEQFIQSPSFPNVLKEFTAQRKQNSEVDDDKTN